MEKLSQWQCTYLQEATPCAAEEVLVTKGAKAVTRPIAGGEENKVLYEGTIVEPERSLRCCCRLTTFLSIPFSLDAFPREDAANALP